MSKHIENTLRESLHKTSKELKEAREGLAEINRLMDAILCRIGLEYGAKLPDGTRVLTLGKRPTVGLLEEYEVRASRKGGGYRISVRRKEKKSEEQGA